MSIGDTLYGQTPNAYDEDFKQLYRDSPEYAVFNLQMDDETLQKMLIKELDKDREHWNKKPWSLQKVDMENVKYFFGDQHNDDMMIGAGKRKYVDNRLFSSIRSILSYATGQLAVPSITPSKSDDEYLRMARELQQALYQHSSEEHVADKVRAAVLNLLLRKRAFLKLRFDPHAGMQGDVVTDVCNPEDIIIDRYAEYMKNPNKIYHRLRATIDDLCVQFPDKKKDILTAFSIKQNRWTQKTRMVTYFECWFSYMDKQGNPAEGVAWFIPEYNLILDKMPRKSRQISPSSAILSAQKLCSVMVPWESTRNPMR